MSKRRAKVDPKPTANKSEPPATDPAAEKPRPLKPRPKLFAILLVGFGLWLILLLTLYFTKVHPLRYPTSATTQNLPH